MNRAKRLNKVMAALEGGTEVRAEDLARQLNVTVRTIYRDMDALRAAGIPIDGTRGQGYRARHALTLPPVSLSETELEALFLGLVAIGQMSDPVLAQAATDLADRLDDLLPQEESRPFDLRAAADLPKLDMTRLNVFRSAMRTRQKLLIEQQDRGQVIRPLHLRHWGRLWHWVGWSESEGGFVEGEMSDISRIDPLPELFVDEPGKTFRDFDLSI